MTPSAYFEISESKTGDNVLSFREALVDSAKYFDDLEYTVATVSVSKRSRVLNSLLLSMMSFQSEPLVRTDIICTRTLSAIHII